ncbi:hypothetical protein EMA8858_02194 [Emticicia aquatica]|uniref:DUF2905 domain-containing protein n=1 Tax=Emticicia aquatica TaxID=1681835 RepID=A0ABM9AQH6_9BACT|nr:DUF2905 domain-containing protein [Emticicia aquatica]CAH0996064.1 hypothetical protein EMA8858_02194 [Emticicia aquatica]
MNQNTGKYLILIGSVLLLIGIFIYYFSDKLHWFGRLPGDIHYENKNFKFSFPLVTMLIISLLLNLILYLVKKFF